MDATDSAIRFDASGVCDHCRDFFDNVEESWRAEERSGRALQKLADRIRDERADDEFDCILGMSGGLDSSYLVHLVVTEMKLRPLVFHVDGGWNTETAVRNIESIVKHLGLELFTHVIDWGEMRDFQLALFKAGVPHLDIPQDHAFIAALYDFALKHRIKYIFNGGNIATECIRNPLEWVYYGTDLAQIRDIRRKFATVPLMSYPLSGVLRHKVYLRYVRGIQVVKPLNLTRYRSREASAALQDLYGWKPYGQKHFESRFTKFYEGYWLPEKFGFDTRRVQYSSLIVTGQMTRNDALARLERPSYDVATIDEDFAYVAMKLGVSVDDLQGYFEQPNKAYTDYRNVAWLFDAGAKVMKRLGLEHSIKR